MADDAETVLHERDYYRSLLSLADREDPQEVVDEALRLLVALVGAREGVIELWTDDMGRTAGWTTSAGCDARRLEDIRAIASRGIVAEAIATGEVVLTSSAHLDPRFSELESVREREIEAVICAPIGRPSPCGYVYLQDLEADRGRARPDKAREYVQIFVDSLGPIVVRALEHAEARQPTHHERSDAFSAIVARSASMRSVLDELRFVAGRDLTVLLTGPTGTGKTLLASAMHAASARSSRPFVELNCAAIPDSLVESELFGSDPGAHSAAVARAVPGKIELADKGTLFLDEVAELTPKAQVSLLQFFQSRSYRRLGSGPLRHADVRIVAATHVDLAQAVKERRFREDLYYRLNVIEVRVPALRERPEDLLPLANRLLTETCRREGWTALRLTPAALRLLAASDWPGNVRELANVLSRASVRCVRRRGDRIDARDLVGDGPTAEVPLTLHEATLAFQRRLIATTLEELEWNVSAASRRLDVARSHLYELIRAHELRRE